jgi:uncharacterized membrane protein YeaQ/YmgE (transglycosylase-associated protein family)
MLLIVWLVVGAFCGWLVGRIVEGYGFGLIGNMVVGVFGAVAGSLLLSTAGIIGPQSVGGEVISSVIGAVIVLLLIGLFKRRE